VPLATFKAWLPQHKGFQFLPTSSSIEEMLLWVFGGPVRATLTSIGLVMFGAWVGLHAYWRTKLRAKHHIQVCLAHATFLFTSFRDPFLVTCACICGVTVLLWRKKLSRRTLESWVKSRH